MARRPSKTGGSQATATSSRPTAKVLTIRATPPKPPQPEQKAPVDGNAPPPPAAADDVVNAIASLTLDVPLKPFAPKRRVPAEPFHFLNLPSELRIKIYDYFFQDIDGVLDLAPDNHKKIHGKLRLMRVCRQVHDEATYAFYSSRTFRIFPTHPGRYFKTKKPLLARMKPVQRRAITSLELRLGPGWSQPPRGWVVNEALGLKDCINVHRLNVFVECDPSDNIFKGFRRSEGFYEAFSRKLLTEVLQEMPAVRVLEFDGWPSVKKSGKMMTMLLDFAAENNVAIEWGPERGWKDGVDDEPRTAFQKLDDSIPESGYGSTEFMLMA